MQFSLVEVPKAPAATPASKLAKQVANTLRQWSKFANALKKRPNKVALPESIDGTAFVIFAKAVITMANKNVMVPDTADARAKYDAYVKACEAEGETPISYHQARITSQFGKGAQSRALVSLYEESGEEQVLDYANALAEGTSHALAVLQAIAKHNNVSLEDLFSSEEE